MAENMPRGAKPDVIAGLDPSAANTDSDPGGPGMDSLAWAHPIVREWFRGKFGTPTEPQERGWPHILSGRATLISAPTGSGKTLAAFLACIDRLVRKALAGELADRTEVLYVSPLKALGNDIHTNLQVPLGEILQLAGQRGLMMPEIRAAVRTGDTLAPERRAMLAHPPHILVTTPESLYILLTAERSRQILKTVETVIVDEIHAVADDKRGSHLALSLERLDALAVRPPVRIGLSATQKPIELVAQFLSGVGSRESGVAEAPGFGVRGSRFAEEETPVIRGPAPVAEESGFSQEDGSPVSVGSSREHDGQTVSLKYCGSETTAVSANPESRIPNPVLSADPESPTPNPASRPCEVVHIPPRRQLDLAVEVPASELGPVASNEMWDEIYQRIAELVRQHRSTLVFVNTRRLAERVSHHLGEILGEDMVGAHHGSLARKLRLAAERKLKAGELRVLVATASLELGIDIGTVDLVCQIGSPRSIAVALQRIGRAGHWRGAIPKGRLFATTRDELLECAALVRGIRRGELDRLAIPYSPLDVLAQQIVAMCAAEDWKEDDLFSLVRRAYPYRQLPRAEYDAIVEMLSEGIAARRGRYGAYLHRDRVNGRLRGRRGSRLAAITSGGAIPETALYTVVAEPEGTVVGTVDEDFAAESMRGEILLLGNTSWRIRRIEFASGRVLVEDAHGAAPDIPFWRGEAPARTAELSQEVSDLRERISALAPGLGIRGSRSAEEDGVRGSTAGAISPANSEDVRSNPVPSGLNPAPFSSPRTPNPALSAAVAWLKQECGLDDAGAEQAVEYIVAGRAALGTVPTLTTVIAERFFDEGGGMQLVIHAPFGGRINKAWGLALRKRFCRSFNFELQAAATDDGLNISLAEQHSFPLAEVFHFLHPETVDQVLEQAALASPIFTTRWRWDAGRALALLRFARGKKVPIHIQRMRADDLLASVFPDVAACQENIVGDIRLPDHPLIREVMKDVLTEAMDLEGLKQVLRGIYDGRIHCVAVDTTSPSQFSHQILNANPYAFLDDAPLEERRARAVELRRVLPEAVAQEVGRLDPAAIQQVREEAWPDVRDADELEDALQTLVALPEDFVPRAGVVSRLNLEDHLTPDPSSPRGRGDKSNPSESSLPSPPRGRGVGGEGVSKAQVGQDTRAGVEAGNSGHESVGAAWGPYLDQLVAEHRAARAVVDGKTLWFAAARARTFLTLYPDAQLASEVAPVDQSQPDSEEAAFALVRGWLSHSGPISAGELAGLVRLPVAEIESALLKLEASGSVLRGRFTDRGSSALATGASSFEVEWCERRLLARIHRLTLGKLRREIEPVTAAQYMRWLLRWQHVAPGTQVAGERGTLEVVRQLQGFEAAANAWEREILARRIAGYDPKVLDQLCLTGAVGWGRLSALSIGDRRMPIEEDGVRGSQKREPDAPALPRAPSPESRVPSPLRSPNPEFRAPSSSVDNRQSAIPRRVVPTSVAPMTFFVREDADWMTARHSAPGDPEALGLSLAARDVLKFLTHRGASFFADIVRGTGRLKSEVETALWELVTAGAITADGFDNLRALIDPKRRAGEGHGRSTRPRHSAGRWSLLYPEELGFGVRGSGFAEKTGLGTRGSGLAELQIVDSRFSIEGTPNSGLPTSVVSACPESPTANRGSAASPEPRAPRPVFSANPEPRTPNPGSKVPLFQHADAIEATCWMLLRRYGVVFREVLARESILPRWRELLIAFRRLEDRGEVRGGRFVSGFLGEQFALPMAVDSLRAARRIEPAGETVTVSAADPLNLVGVIVPGERVPALSGRYVSFRDGVPVAGTVSGEERETFTRFAGAQ